ncbi:hypothetical protein EAF00_006669 [Botryotinia globosa]|nr:hypothetical protein EAF00_006669 [Botryotinia globosa]
MTIEFENELLQEYSETEPLHHIHALPHTLDLASYNRYKCDLSNRLGNQAFGILSRDFGTLGSSSRQDSLGIKPSPWSLSDCYLTLYDIESILMFSITSLLCVTTSQPSQSSF